MDLNKVVWEIREFADGGKVSLSLFRRKGKRNWMLRVYGSDNKEKVVSLKTPDGKAAKDIESEIRSRLNQVAISGVVPYKTRTFFDEWLDTTEKHVAPGSFKRFRVVLDKVLPFMPPEVHQVDSRNIERYKDWLLREGYKPRSVILELNTLRRVFEKARRLGYTNANPCDDVKKPKKPLPEVEPYSESELEAIFAELERRTGKGFREQCTEAWGVYREIFYCLHYTGMRVGDAINLRWENVSLPFSTIRIHQQKTRREAVIRIPTDYKARLLKLADGRKEPTGLVYRSTSGNRVKYSQLDVAIRTAMKSIGIEKKSPIHSFRHTVAMRLLSAGVPVHQAAAQLGDTVETVVRHYIKTTVPELVSIDSAYAQGSRKSHGEMAEMADFEATAIVDKQLPNNQKSQLTKGFSDGSIKPPKTAIM